MPETITTTVIGVRRRRRSVSYTYPDDGRDYGDSYYTEYDHDGNETGRRARRDSLGHPGRAPSPPPRPSTTDPSLGQSYAIWDEPAGGAPRHITAGSSHHQSASRHGSHAQSDHETARPPHASSYYAGSRAPSHSHHHTSSRHGSHAPSHRSSGSHHSHHSHSHHSSSSRHGHGGGGSRHHGSSHRREDPIAEETESVATDQLYMNKSYPVLPVRPKSIHYAKPHHGTHDRDHDRHGHRSSHHHGH
ncbi:hypothetical protein ANO14919_103100 [Xylariales sp. No.14919]|nr:hypothetical protein ANO14919_103100 [Xylariales sp. No.14919]